MHTNIHRTAARYLALNTAIVTLVISGALVAAASEPAIREDLPPGLVECWNPHTTGITLEVGRSCPEYKRSLAQADQIEPADRTVKTLRVAYAEPITSRVMYVELNDDGSTYTLPPCKVEDGRHCYWAAGARGNGIGTSFISLRRQIIHTNKF